MIDLLRVIPKQEIDNELSLNILEREFICNIGFSEKEVSVDTLFYLLCEKQKFSICNNFILQLKEIYLFNSLINEIPIGIRVACKFKIIKGDFISIQLDEEGYVKQKYKLFEPPVVHL